MIVVKPGSLLPVKLQAILFIFVDGGNLNPHECFSCTHSQFKPHF